MAHPKKGSGQAHSQASGLLKIVIGDLWNAMKRMGGVYAPMLNNSVLVKMTSWRSVEGIVEHF